VSKSATDNTCTPIDLKKFMMFADKGRFFSRTKITEYYVPDKIPRTIPDNPVR